MTRVLTIATLLALLLTSQVLGQTAPVTVERATGSLTVISRFSGTLLLDGEEIAFLTTDEEVTLRNVPVGLRQIEIVGPRESASAMASVKKDQTTVVRIAGATTSSMIDELSSDPMLLSLGLGVFFYDMEVPVSVAEVAVSRYVSPDLAVGGFVAFDKYDGPGKFGLQITFGDTRFGATGVRLGLYSRDSAGLLGVSAYLDNVCLSLDYSFPDGRWPGEIHLIVSYGFRT